VLLRLESGGGMVHSYGLAVQPAAAHSHAGQPLTVSRRPGRGERGLHDGLRRQSHHRGTVCGDRLHRRTRAAAELPPLLKKNDIDFEMITAGEYKRTLTLFGENTDKGREKFREDIEDTHALFKAFVKENRRESWISTRWPRGRSGSVSAPWT
jgi:serine protease SohB